MTAKGNTLTFTCSDVDDLLTTKQKRKSLEKNVLFFKVAFGLCILICLYKAVVSKCARKTLIFIYSQAVPHSLQQST